MSAELPSHHAAGLSGVTVVRAVSAASAASSSGRSAKPFPIDLGYERRKRPLQWGRLVEWFPCHEARPAGASSCDSPAAEPSDVMMCGAR